MSKQNKSLQSFMIAMLVFTLIFCSVSKIQPVFAKQTKSKIPEKVEKFIVDRIVQDKAVLEKEDLSLITVSKDLLPKRTKEGTVLTLKKGKYRIDYKATREREKYLKHMLNELFS